MAFSLRSAVMVSMSVLLVDVRSASICLSTCVAVALLISASAVLLTLSSILVSDT